jgi:hypothetical protein
MRSDQLSRAQHDLALDLLYGKRLSCNEAARHLQAQGIPITALSLRTLKKKSFDVMLRADREEKMSDYMLDSFDKIKVEFEDLFAHTKRLLVQYEDAGDTEGQVAVIRELKEQIIVALKRLGEFKTGMINVKADRVNILNTSDFMDAFKKIQRQWFASMEAKIENGKMVFEKPSAELIDDFYRYQAEEMRKKAIEVVVVESGTDNGSTDEVQK